MKNLRFRIHMTLEADREENIIGVDEDAHEETVQSLLENLLHDIDGVDIKHIKVSLENT
tara:strand:+ start:3538 stop:3714 length:177 start_codon:yes stop_codon:yes gene_type:complete